MTDQSDCGFQISDCGILRAGIREQKSDENGETGAVRSSRAALDSAEPFGPESFDPELTTEGLTADGLVAGCGRRFIALRCPILQ